MLGSLSCSNDNGEIGASCVGAARCMCFVTAQSKCTCSKIVVFGDGDAMLLRFSPKTGLIETASSKSLWWQ